MTNKDFVNFCKAAKDKPASGTPIMYMWGDYGRPITEAHIAEKAKQYPVHYDAAYQNELRSHIATGIGCDCTGLIKWFLWTGGNIDNPPKYNAATDNSASGWYNAAKVRGKIEDIPLDRVGLIVSKPDHCGVYIGDGNVIECTKGKFGNGVVQTRLTDRPWEQWCECVYISYEDENPAESKSVALAGIPAHVLKDCDAYADKKLTLKIGTVFVEDEIEYLGDREQAAAGIIYPTAASEKIAFIAKSNLKI